MTTTAITGCTSGIGAALRARLEAAGDRVVGVDVRGAEIEADLGTPAGRHAAVAGVRAFASQGLDRLVLCAGLGSHVEDLAAIPSVNYFGAVEVLEGLRDAMAGRPGAAALVISSNSARFGPFDDHPFVLACLEHDEERARELASKENGFLAYGGSKHALARAVRRRAREWGAAGIRLNAIAPGATETPMLQATREHPVFGRGFAALELPLGRVGTPDEIAGVMEFMLGPQAGYVHGAIWFVDGGNEAVTIPDRF